MISERAKKIKPSPTLALASRAQELVAQGKKVISLVVGEPDWPTLPIAEKSGIDAIQKGHTKYAPSMGLVSLRKAICEDFKKDFDVEFKASEVCVTPGGKFAVYAVVQALCNPGDEALIVTPYWVSYPTICEMNDVKPIIIATDEKSNFKLTPSQLKQKITPNTKLLILNSPSNPTGEMFSKSELLEIAEVLRGFPNLYVLSDDIYDKLVFDSARASHLLQVAPDLKSRVIIVNGASKSFSMTGWRLGWVMGAEDLVSAIGRIQSQTTSCAAPFTQLAVQAALEKGDKELSSAVQNLKQRRDLCYELLQQVPLIKAPLPKGAFYFWIDIRDCLGKRSENKTIETSTDFCRELLEQHGVALVPGIEFGEEGYLRLSYAVESQVISDAISRIKTFVGGLV